MKGTTEQYYESNKNMSFHIMHYSI